MVQNYYVNIKKVGNDFSDREIKIFQELIFSIITIATLQARSKKGQGGVALVIYELNKTDGDIMSSEHVLAEPFDDDVFDDFKNIITTRLDSTFKRCGIENISISITN